VILRLGGVERLHEVLIEFEVIGWLDDDPRFQGSDRGE